jgi:hypothetical protein
VTELTKEQIHETRKALFEHLRQSYSVKASKAIISQGLKGLIGELAAEYAETQAELAEIQKMLSGETDDTV